VASLPIEVYRKFSSTKFIVAETEIILPEGRNEVH
jgi:hypothetical protein